MSNSIVDELEEGALYVVKKGILTEITTDPDDTMKKIKITDDAFQAVKELQNRLRKAMAGYRPDISTVCSALIKDAAQRPDATMVVKAFCLALFQTLSDERGDSDDS